MMRGPKTSVIEKLRPVLAFLQRRGEHEMSLGYIQSVRGRKDATVDIKVQEISGAVLLSCTTKRYHQEIRLYTQKTANEIFSLLKEIEGEKFRIRRERKKHD